MSHTPAWPTEAQPAEEAGALEPDKEMFSLERPYLYQEFLKHRL